MTDIVKLLRMQHKFGLGADAHKAADTIQALRQRVNELEDYLREVAVEAGLPPETLYPVFTAPPK